MQEKITAVVVTFNRLHLLPGTITALQAQTRPVDSIVVVNNDSTDGTREWLEAQEGLHIIHQNNVGCSGGFATGVKAALEGGADWVWMMDDDVQPDADCLQILLRHKNVSACLHPLRVEPDGSIQEEERWFDPSDCKLVSLHNQSYKSGKEFWFRNTGSFEGMLLAKGIIEKIGFPDPRFFICHDDLAYGLLASKHTNVAVVPAAVIRRQRVGKSEDSVYNYEYYYMYRNLWLLEEYAADFLPGYGGYRKRRIRLQFLYCVYKILFVDKPANKRKALRTLSAAYRDYKRKKGGMK